MKLHRLTVATTDAGERGGAIGRLYRDCVRTSSARYLEHFGLLGITATQVRDIADSSRAALLGWFPELVRESDAMAAAAGIEPWQALAVAARTEIIAAAPTAAATECSTAVRIPRDGGAPETIQTWDWHDRLVEDGLLHRLIATSGREVKLFAEFGTPAKIGVNDAGLGVHFNILSHASDHPVGGVPVHAVARRILEEATTLQEAREIARSASVSASTSLTVVTAADGGAEAASLELAPAGMGVVEPSADGWLVHTNHFLDPALSAGDTVRTESTTRERYAHVEARTPEMAGRGPRDRAAALCGSLGGAAPVCVRPDPSLRAHEQWETLLTVALDLPGFALDVHAGSPDQIPPTGFERF